MGPAPSLLNVYRRILVPQRRAWVHIRLCTMLRREQLSSLPTNRCALAVFFVAMVLFHALLENFLFSRHMSRVSSTLYRVRLIVLPGPL